MRVSGDINRQKQHIEIVPPDRDEDTGRFSAKYPLESFLQAVGELDVATTSKVAEEVGCSYDLAYRRLHELEEEGDLSNQKVGGTFVWNDISE